MMTKMKPLFVLLFALVPFLETRAQEEVRVPQFGYLSYNAIFEQMPEYRKAQEDFAVLRMSFSVSSLSSCRGRRTSPPASSRSGRPNCRT